MKLRVVIKSKRHLAALLMRNEYSLCRTFDNEIFAVSSRYRNSWIRRLALRCDGWNETHIVAVTPCNFHEYITHKLPICSHGSVNLLKPIHLP